MTTPRRTLDLAARRCAVVGDQAAGEREFACAIGKSATMRSTNRDRLTGSELLAYRARHGVARAIHADLVVVGRSAKMQHRRAGSLGRRLVGREDAPVVVVVP
jgi:hypothetical protein